MANGRQIALIGLAGAGAWVVYEYTQYSSEMSTVAQGNAQAIATGEAILPFFTYLGMKLGIGKGQPTTQAQAQALQLFDLMTGASTPISTQAPGTTSSAQPTTVSTAPSTTPTSTGTTAPTTVALPQPSVADLQSAINMTVATADQWNYAYKQLTGYPIESLYGANFDAIYGSVGSDGTRPTGNISANAFLTLPAAKGLAAKTSLSGLGAIRIFEGLPVNTTGNMLYLAHHPLPYHPTYTLKGLGAITQATGFEKALFAALPLRSNRIQ